MRIRLNCNSLEGNDYLFEDHLFQSFLRLSARDIPYPPLFTFPMIFSFALSISSMSMPER